MTMPKDDELRRLEDELRQPLSRLVVKPVASGDTARLLQALQPAFDELKEAIGHEGYRQRTLAAIRRPSLLRLIRSQFSSYSKLYWAASLLIFGMLLLSLPTRDEHVSATSVGNTFSLVLPALLLASLAYSFRSWNREMRMIESITPYPPALLLIVRTMIVIGLNLIMGVAGSIYMNVSVEQFPLLPFVLQWLSLLLLVSGVTAYVLMWKGFKAAFAWAFVFWAGWNTMSQRMIPLQESSAAGGNWAALQAAALAAGLLLLVLAYRRSCSSRLLP